MKYLKMYKLFESDEKISTKDLNKIKKKIESFNKQFDKDSLEDGIEASFEGSYYAIFPIKIDTEKVYFEVINGMDKTPTIDTFNLTYMNVDDILDQFKQYEKDIKRHEKEYEKEVYASNNDLEYDPTENEDDDDEDEN